MQMRPNVARSNSLLTLPIQMTDCVDFYSHDDRTGQKVMFVVVVVALHLDLEKPGAFATTPPARRSIARILGRADGTGGKELWWRQNCRRAGGNSQVRYTFLHYTTLCSPLRPYIYMYTIDMLCRAKGGGGRGVRCSVAQLPLTYTKMVIGQRPETEFLKITQRDKMMLHRDGTLTTS